MFKILFADDEIKMRETVRDYLGAKGLEVILAKDGADACEKASEQDFDLVILDIMMPETDGITACRSIRKENSVPILFLTALGDERDFLAGYSAGCDDYLTKPYPLSVLYEKCMATIRRYRGIDRENRMEENGIILDLAARKVFVDGKEIVLSNKDFKLLKYLMDNKNIVLKREIILSRIWGYDFDGDERVVDTHIKIIRKALGEKSDCIKTVINVGYCFEVK